MSVTVRPYVNGEDWEVDIRIVFPDGSKLRRRLKAPAASKSAARRWGEARQAVLLSQGPPKQKEKKEREVLSQAKPTLAEFAPRFLEKYAKANRHKPSGVAAKETILRLHLLSSPMGEKPLDHITNEDIQDLKWRLNGKASKTVNNILSVLNTLLGVAVEWDVIENIPCTIRLLPVSETEAPYYDFDEYRSLREAAEAIDLQTYITVLLGGDAGLRCGEIMALEQTDVNYSTGQIHVQRSDWKGQVTLPKGGRTRRIPMTDRLADALGHHRHMKSPRVLCQKDGEPLTQKIVQRIARKAARKANVDKAGVHILRHTFCSHLAMKGAPMRAIQELAGHKDLKTTQRYMHLSPRAVEGAISLLEKPSPFGEILEAAGTGGARSNR